MKKTTMMLSVLTLGVVGLAQTEAKADDISSLFNTGVQNDHTTLTGDGLADLHYSLVNPGANAYVSVVAGQYPWFGYGNWVDNTSTSKWLSPQADPAGTPAVVSYDYQTTFDLTGLTASTAILSGKLAADDNVAVLLNGSQVLSPFGTWSQFSNFTIDQSNGHFINGVNTLDFVVTNSGAGATGLQVQIAGRAAAVPEASTVAMFAGLSMSGLGLLRRRTRRK